MIKSTLYFIIFKCRAATKPSPPLFPGPTRTHISALGFRLRILFETWAIANPASYIKVSEGNPYFYIKVESKRAFN